MAVNSGIFSDPNAVIDRAMRAMRRPAAPSRDAVYQTYAADQDVYNRTWKPTPYEPRLAEVVQVAEELGVDLDTARDLIRESRGIEGGGIDITEHMAPNLQYANFLSLLQNHQQHLAPFVERQVTALTQPQAPRNEPAPVAPSIINPPEYEETDEEAEAKAREEAREAEARAAETAAANRAAAAASALFDDDPNAAMAEAQAAASREAANFTLAEQAAQQQAIQQAMEDRARLDAMFTQKESLLGQPRGVQPPQEPVAPPIDIARVTQNNIAAAVANYNMARAEESERSARAAMEMQAEQANQLAQEEQGYLGAEMKGARQQEARALAAIEQAEIDALTAAIAQNYQEPNMPAPVTQAQINQAIAAGLISQPTEATRSLQGPPGPTPARSAPAGLGNLNDVMGVREADIPSQAFTLNNVDDVQEADIPSTPVGVEADIPGPISIGQLAEAIAAQASLAMDDTPPSYQNEMETAAEAAQAQAARDIAAAMAQNEMGMGMRSGPTPGSFRAAQQEDDVDDSQPAPAPAPTQAFDLQAALDRQARMAKEAAIAKEEKAIANIIAQLEDDPNLNAVPNRNYMTLEEKVAAAIARNAPTRAQVIETVRDLLGINPQRAPTQTTAPEIAQGRVGQFAPRQPLGAPILSPREAIARAQRAIEKTMQAREMDAQRAQDEQARVGQARRAAAEANNPASRASRGMQDYNPAPPLPQSPPFVSMPGINTSPLPGRNVPNPRQSEEDRGENSNTLGKRSSLDSLPGLGILGRVLADLNPFSISPAQADTPRFQPQQPPREEPFRLPPPMLPPQLAPPQPFEMPDEIIRRYQLDRLRRQGQPRNPDDVPLDEDTPLPPSRGRPSPIPSPFPSPFTNPFTAPMPAPEPAPTPPAPQPAPSFTPTPGGSFRSAQERGIDDKGEPSRSAPRSVNPTPAPAPAPVPSIAVPSPVPGVAAPDAAPNAPKGAGEPSTTGPGVASPSFGAGIGVGDSKDGKSSSYGASVRASEQMEDDPNIDDNRGWNRNDLDEEDPNADLNRGALSFQRGPIGPIGPPTTLGDEAAARAAQEASRAGPTPGSFRGAQEVGMQALENSLASLAASYASPVSMQSNYGVQSEDTTSEDPDGGLPGGQAPGTSVPGMDPATASGFGNNQSEAQDGPGTNESTTTSDTTSPSGGGGDGNTPGTETTNYGEMGFGVFGGDGGQTGDTGDTSGGGRGGSGSVGGDVAGAAAAAAGLGSSPADGESTSGGPMADGGRVKAPAHYKAIIERALRAARRSRAA